MLVFKFAYVGEFTSRRRRVGVGELTGYQRELAFTCNIYNPGALG